MTTARRLSDGELGRDCVEVIYAAYLAAERGARVTLPFNAKLNSRQLSAISYQLRIVIPAKEGISVPPLRRGDHRGAATPVSE